ncbi:MAG: hypothetical protein K9L57_10285 [Spirochaetaceae bacterium]|nr:hypothetical protein [Spirochaetia bacterium]MCF7952011.1 hypothetical protein [Spirochaetaceae bacterium]
MPDEYSSEARRWAFMIDLFMMCADPSTGALMHLPAAGGVMDQGYTTMQALECLRSVMVEEKTKALKRKARRGKT